MHKFVLIYLLCSYIYNNHSCSFALELIFDPVTADMNGTIYMCVTLTYYGMQEKQLLIQVTDPPAPICSPNCTNGGTCVNVQGLPMCMCPDGYSGSICQCPPGYEEQGTECVGEYNHTCMPLTIKLV